MWKYFIFLSHSKTSNIFLVTRVSAIFLVPYFYLTMKMTFSLGHFKWLLFKYISIYMWVCVCVCMIKYRKKNWSQSRIVMTLPPLLRCVWLNFFLILIKRSMCQYFIPDTSCTEALKKTMSDFCPRLYFWLRWFWDCVFLWALVLILLLCELFPTRGGGRDSLACWLFFLISFL